MIILDHEEWRPAFGGYYEASSHGRVRRSLPWTRRGRTGRVVTYTPKGIPLQPTLRKRDGRYHVSLLIDGKRLLRGVHQVVADAFLGPCPAGLEVNHINGNRTDNRPGNLEYVTGTANKQHAYRLGLVKPAPRMPGNLNPRAKLTENDIRAIRARRLSGETMASLARVFGVSTSAIDFICRRVNWRHVA